MQYDPIKRSLGNFFNSSPLLRKLFYYLLDLLLLRSWHVKRAFNNYAKKKDAANILDAGMGFGQYSYFMARQNPSFIVKGVDVKPEQVKDCTLFFKSIKQDNASFALADLTKLVEENNYDFILSVDVMEHIEEDVLVFKNFFKSMKRGGMLLISTPSDKGGSDVHDESEESFIDEHVRDGYSIDDITEKLKGAGFREVSALYTYGRPGNISWRISMKYPIKMLNKSYLFFIQFSYTIQNSNQS